MDESRMRYRKIGLLAVALLALSSAAAPAATPTAGPAATVQARHRARPALPAIEAAQRALDRDGAGIAVDGRYGPKTERALLNWQAAHRLTPTGRLDRATRRSLGIA